MSSQNPTPGEAPSLTFSRATPSRCCARCTRALPIRKKKHLRSHRHWPSGQPINWARPPCSEHAFLSAARFPHPSNDDGDRCSKCCCPHPTVHLAVQQGCLSTEAPLIVFRGPEEGDDERAFCALWRDRERGMVAYRRRAVPLRVPSRAADRAWPVGMQANATRRGALTRELSRRTPGSLGAIGAVGHLCRLAWRCLERRMYPDTVTYAIGNVLSLSLSPPQRRCSETGATNVSQRRDIALTTWEIRIYL